MRFLVADIRSKLGSSLVFGRKLQAGKDELLDWRERAYLTRNGQPYILASTVKTAMLDCVRFAYKQKLVEDGGAWQRREAWQAKHLGLLSHGLLVKEDALLIRRDTEAKLNVEDLQPRVFRVPKDGVRGCLEKVEKCFPVLEEWSTRISFCVLTDELTDAFLRICLERTGMYIGFGAMRIQNGGTNGGFILSSLRPPRPLKSVAEARRKEKFR